MDAVLSRVRQIHRPDLAPVAVVSPARVAVGACDLVDLAPTFRAVVAEGSVLTPLHQMPVIFVDLHDGKNFVKDTQGFDLPDKEAVRERLVRIMTKIARILSADSDRQDFLAIARDANGKILFRVHLSLDVEEVDQP